MAGVNPGREASSTAALADKVRRIAPAYPPVPEPGAVADHFGRALALAERDDNPYRHWNLSDVLPESLCTAILTLPVAPPALGRTDGTRNSYNDKRTFFTPVLQSRFAACRVLAQALQRPEIARQFQKTCGIKVAGGFLRMEYMQDLDGMWLEPHTDIPDKLFSMVIYLCTGPDAKDWGTDIYDSNRQWVGRTSAKFNTAAIFVPGANTWHGFNPRPIDGVRRLMEINYVKNWRDREQLCFPESPISID